MDDFHFQSEWDVVRGRDAEGAAGRGIERLARGAPVFNSFFSIASLEVPYPGRLGRNGLTGEFYGIHEDNDASKRLDGRSSTTTWTSATTWSTRGRGFYAVDPTNEAFKFGVNYIIYGLTH
ncbi:MAG: hypothetical protein MZV64_42695 [Ignavibacteriales bacterium]|nr:hypothetical protein [Ignavibacteriales bacterium]